MEIIEAEIADELPPDLQEILNIHNQLKQKREQERQRQLDALSKVIAKKRDEVVKARRSSGVEQIWEEDQHNYEGVDEFNRGGLKPKYTKSRSTDGGIMSNAAGGKNMNQCTAFFNITRQFVDSASARMGDILLPAGDWNWSIAKTPVPEYVDQIAQGNVLDQSGAIIQPDYAQSSDHAEREERAENRIKDWLVETRYHAECRKVIESSARLGSGVLKGCYPKKRRTKAFYNNTLEIIEEVVPSSKAIDIWDFFPDYPNCGEDIQDGEFVFERDYITAKDLNEFANSPELGYFPDAIKRVIEEGPGKKYTDGSGKTKSEDMFEVWYYTGWIDVEQTQIFDTDDQGIEGEDDDECQDFRMFVIVMVNDTIIKGHESPLDTTFPYDMMVWQRVANMPWGIGVSRQMREPQQFMTVSARNLVDNMGLAAIPMIAIRRDGIEPENKQWEIKKGKVWWLTDEMVKNIGESIQFLAAPTMQDELVANMQLATKMAEDATGINFLLQGQQGSAPDTVGGMELLHRNASSLLRRIARIYDENVTERHIKRYHEWLLLYGNDDEKCDLQIQAIGSSALVEREIQEMELLQLLQFSLNPMFGISPHKTMQEMLRAKRFEPAKFEMDEEEKQRVQQIAPPQVMAAQIRSQTELQKAQMASQVDMQKVKSDQDRDALFQQSVAQRSQLDYEYKMKLLEQENIKLQLQKDLAILEYSTKQQISLDETKAKLASDAMKLNVQKELASMTAVPKQVITPPVEPVGLAPDGQAYQK